MNTRKVVLTLAVWCSFVAVSVVLATMLTWPLWVKILLSCLILISGFWVFFSVREGKKKNYEVPKKTKEKAGWV